ncbi:MAG: Wzz/FepE/Etk N-terminal domain-containing protein [bacterium]|nr:Wzz/FepE/Etk N-terminal domain-containing protein [bacterium]
MLEDKKQQITVWDYGQILFRRKWFFVIPTVVVFLCAVIGAHFLPKIYQSSSTILVQESGLLNTRLVGDVGIGTPMQARLLFLDTKIKDSTKLKQLIQRIGLDRTLSSPQQMESLIDHIRKNLTVGMERWNPLVTIRYEGQDPYTVQQVVKGITDLFMEESALLEETESDVTVDFIQTQLMTYKEKLEEAERALQKFKEENLLELPVEVSGRGGTEGEAAAKQRFIVSPDLDKLTTTQGALMEVNLELQTLEKQKAIVRRQLSAEKRVIISEVTKEENPVAAKLQEKLLGLHSDLADARTQFTEEHPKIVGLETMIDRVKKQLDQEEKTIRSGERTTINPAYQSMEQQYRDIEIKMDALHARQRELALLAAKYKERVKDVPQRERAYAKMIRDKQTVENLYNMFMNQLQVAGISGDVMEKKKEKKFIVVKEANLPTSPVKPRKDTIALLGLFIGMGLGLGCVFAVEYTDHSFRSAEDAQIFLGLASLGATANIITEEDEARQQLYSRLLLAVLGFILVVAVTAGSIQYYRKHIQKQASPISVILRKGE